MGERAEKEDSAKQQVQSVRKLSDVVWGKRGKEAESNRGSRSEVFCVGRKGAQEVGMSQKE